MIIERQLENAFMSTLSAMSDLSAAQIVGSRTIAAAGQTKSEDSTAPTVVAVACGFRQNDAFSLSPISMPMSITIMTRSELDPTSEYHDTVVESIAALLSRWHKYGDEMTDALTTEKFLAGELRMDGGTNRVYDTTNSTWSETLTFTIRGSEKFIAPPRMTTIVKYTDGRTVELDIQGELGSDSIPDREYISELDIGNAVTSIGENAFDRCAYLETVIIPESVETIGAQGFSRTRQLTSITIKGNGLKVIGVGAFAAITALTSISLPDSVVSIGRSAFEDCVSLTSIDIPASVQTMDREVFFGSSELMSVTFSGKDKATVQGMDNYSWALPSGCVIHCTDGDITVGSETVVQYTDGRTVELDIQGEIDRYSIPDKAYVSELDIGNGVTNIGNYAFAACSSLTSVTIPDSVSSIGNYGFSRCSGLSSVTIPDSVTSIGYGAFFNCSCLTSMTIPDSVTKIDDYAFHGCSSRSSVTIGNGVSSIGDWAFYNCRGLESATIGDSLASIGDLAFYSCISLTSVEFEGNAPTVGEQAFIGVASGCKAVISSTATGFPAAGETWNGLVVEVKS